MSYPRAPLDDSLIGLLFAKMLLVYGKRFTGSQSPDFTPQQLRAHWATELAGLSEAGLRYAMEHLPADYVPNVLQVRLIANQRPPEGWRALPAPQPSTEVKQRERDALQALRDQFSNKPQHLDVRWAERIVANPQGKSRYAIRLATEVLREHGRLQ